ncbi:MAG TPA: hypothetical protein VKD71_05345 [Gemmataceae bacterium]|nr:hypothetical protein [Gemmataceae bacterium]
MPASVEPEALCPLAGCDDESNPRLLFTSDYAGRHPGSVHSAYQSGIDAMSRAIEARRVDDGAAN